MSCAHVARQTGKMSDVLDINGNVIMYILGPQKFRSYKKKKITLSQQCFQRRHGLESLFFYDRSPEQMLRTLWLGSDDGVTNHLQ